MAPEEVVEKEEPDQEAEARVRQLRHELESPEMVQRVSSGQ